MLSIITNGYVLPFHSKPNLVRFPLILSEYKALQKDQDLADCIQFLLSKNAIERVENVRRSRLFLVPKPHQRWRPVIDLSRLNTFLYVEKFKMETPESIRTSLIPGEWVSLVPVSRGSPSEQSGSGSLGWIINQEKSGLKSTQVLLCVGYEYHLDSGLVKPTQERWLKLQDLILRLKSNMF